MLFIKCCDILTSFLSDFLINRTNFPLSENTFTSLSLGINPGISPGAAGAGLI